MSDIVPDGPYVYQPYGMQDRERWASGRIYGVGGVDTLATIKGLTKAEAERIAAALDKLGASAPRAPRLAWQHETYEVEERVYRDPAPPDGEAHWWFELRGRGFGPYFTRRDAEAALSVLKAAEAQAPS